MATMGHCFYCFECLSASFDRRDPPLLDRVEELWDEYERSQDTSHQVSTKLVDQVDTEEELEDDLDSEEEEDAEDDKQEGEEEEGEDEVDDEGETEGEDDSTAIQSPRPQLPSISRLKVPTPSLSSSKSSTPSVLSANSSNSALTNASSVSSMTSRPSYASRLSTTDSYPLFVTWNSISRASGHKSLRGCIGTFDPLPLSSGLGTYALTSAFDDARFSPIPSALLSALSCSLTLLANFEPCRDALDWVLGKHGLRISFTHRGRRHGATYLPDVAIEQGWSKEETLESLMKKAGWDGGSGHGGYARRILRGSASRSDDGGTGKPWDDVGDFKAVRYTGLKASATYGDWREWRSWVEEHHGTI